MSFWDEQLPARRRRRGTDGRAKKGQLQRTKRGLQNKGTRVLSLFSYIFIPISKKHRLANLPEFPCSEKTTLYGLMVCRDRYRPIIDIHGARRYNNIHTQVRIVDRREEKRRILADIFSVCGLFFYAVARWLILFTYSMMSVNEILSRASAHRFYPLVFFFSVNFRKKLRTFRTNGGIQYSVPPNQNVR